MVRSAGCSASAASNISALSRSSRSSPVLCGPLPDRTPCFLRGERRSQDTRAARPPASLEEDRAEALAGLAREQSHHADRGPLVEDREQDRVVVDDADVQALLGALVEEHRELALAQQPGERRRRAEAAGGEGADGDRVERARRAREGHGLTATPRP